MRLIPLELSEETAQEVYMAQHLITITTALYVYRWTDGQNSIYYDGHWWVAKGITFDTLGSTLTGQLDNLTLEIDNADLAFSDSVLSETDIKAGNECVLEIVYLDNNLAIIGVPVILFQGFVDRISMDRGKARVEIFSHMIRWKLSTPRRQHTPSCPWLFKGVECGYDGNVYRNPTSDILAEFTRSHLASNYLNVDDRLGDLCIGQIFTESSNDGAGNVVANAFDRNIATYWKSTNAAPPHWIKVQFAVAKILTRCRMYNNTAAYSPIIFTILGSNDNLAWVELDSRNGVAWGSETYKDFEWSNEIAFLYYKIYVDRNTAGGNYTSFKEIEFYGPSTQVNDSDYNYASGNINGLCEGGTATESSYYGGYVGTLAFDNDPSTYWCASGAALPQWIKYQLAAAKTAIVYTLQAPSSYEGRAPKNFKLQGSNNDSTWNDLNSQTGITFTASEVKTFTIATPGSYLYYRLYVTAITEASNYATVAEMELFDASLLTVSDLFGFSAISLGADLTGIAVTVRVRAKQTTAAARNLTALLKIGGVVYAASAITPTTSFVDYDFVWLTNPATSAAWTVANIAAIQGMGYGIPLDAGGHVVTVAECFIKVYNSITALSCNLSAERCVELNNRDNFGGFIYISELQTKEFWWGSKQKIWGGGI